MGVLTWVGGGSGVAVGSRAGVGSGVSVGSGSGVGTGVSVGSGTGVSVGSGTGVSVGVGSGVFVGASVGIAGTVGVTAAAAVSDSELSESSESVSCSTIPSQATRKTANSRANPKIPRGNRGTKPKLTWDAHSCVMAQPEPTRRLYRRRRGDISGRPHPNPLPEGEGIMHIPPWYSSSLSIPTQLLRPLHAIQRCGVVYSGW